jgi:catechol 2,3-dioxygenase-like lactoylglutathione lyase family enzyme
MTDEIKRTTLMVRDAEKAAQWYETVFGMTRWMDVPFTLTGERLAAGNKGDKTRLVILKCKHDKVGMIGLLEWVEPKQDAPEELPAKVPFGMPIFVVDAEDAAATADRARECGSRIHAEPGEWTVTGADGRKKDMLGCSFWDLDGYFFEVNQIVRIHDA